MKKILLAASFMGLMGIAIANTTGDDEKGKKKSCSSKEGKSCCASKKGKKSCDMKGEKTDAPAGETKPADEKK